MDFSTVTAAGLTGTEAAFLFKVSRVTLHKWSTGAEAPSSARVGRVGALLASLARAVDAGDLPLYAKAERREVAPKKFIRPDVWAAVKKHIAG